MLQTKDLTYSYKNGPSLRFPDLHCAAGEHRLLLGQSGSGKTTLLHLLGGLLTPTGGSLRVGDTDISKLSGAAADKFRGQNIGIIFQKAHFVKSLNVEENLLLAQSLAGLPTDKNKITDLLQRLNIGHKLHARPQRLSQGEQQRAAIARALVNNPRVILADEPTSALDDKNTEEVIRLLEEQARAVNAVLLIVTHDRRLKDRFAHRTELTEKTLSQS